MAGDAAEVLAPVSAGGAATAGALAAVVAAALSPRQATAQSQNTFGPLSVQAVCTWSRAANIPIPAGTTSVDVTIQTGARTNTLGLDFGIGTNTFWTNGPGVPLAWNSTLTNTYTIASTSTVLGIDHQVWWGVCASGHVGAVTYSGTFRGADTSAGTAGATTAYTYDPLGNRLSQVRAGVTTASTYDRADRITSGGLSVNANGNLTNPGTPNTPTTLIYDQANRLAGRTQATSNDFPTTTNNYLIRYDGDGKRVAVQRTTTRAHPRVIRAW